MAENEQADEPIERLTKEEIPIAFDVHATPEALREPSQWVNYARTQANPDHILVYFFSVGADALELPEVAPQVRAEGENVRLPTGNKLRVNLTPAAKLAMPPHLVPALISSLQAQLKVWQTAYGKESVQDHEKQSE